MAEEKEQKETTLVLHTPKALELRDQLDAAQAEKAALEKLPQNPGFITATTGLLSVLVALCPPVLLNHPIMVLCALPVSTAMVLGGCNKKNQLDKKLADAATRMEDLKAEFAEEKAALTQRLKSQVEAIIDQAFKESGHLSSGDTLPLIAEDGSRKLIHIQSFECGTAMDNGIRVSSTRVIARLHDAVEDKAQGHTTLGDALPSFPQIERVYREELKM